MKNYKSYEILWKIINNKNLKKNNKKYEKKNLQIMKKK